MTLSGARLPRHAEAKPVKPRSVRASSTWLLFGKAFQMGAGFVFWIVAARAATVEEVGVAAATVSAVMVCTQLGVFGTGSAVIVAVGRGEPLRETLDTAFTLVTVAAALMSSVYLTATWATDSPAVSGTDAGVLVAIFLVSAVFGTVMICQDQVSIALRHAEGAATRYAVGGFLTLAVTLLAATLWQLSATAVFACWSVGSVVAACVGAVQIRRWTAYRYRPSFHVGRLRDMARVGLPNQLLTLSERLPPAVMPLVLAHWGSPTATAYWYPAWMMAWAAFTAPISVGMVQFADMVREPVRSREIIRSGVVWSLALGGSLCLVLVIGANVLLSLLGSEYADASATALRILVIGLLPFVVLQAYNAQCRASNRTGEAIVLGLLVLVSVTVGTALLADRGATAIAVLWVGCTSVAAVWACVRLRMLLRRTVGASEPRHG